MTSLTKERLRELVEAARNKLPVPLSPNNTTVRNSEARAAAAEALQRNPLFLDETISTTQNSKDNIEFLWNPEQNKAITKALNGESFCLIGAAGTGKTTTLKEIVRRLVVEDKLPPTGASTKHLLSGLPGIVLTSFTRRAVRNIRRAVSSDIAPHCITLHKLLEYEPVYFEVFDEVSGKMRNTMRFEPARHRRNPLPAGLRTIVIDESSMVSTELFSKLLDALPYHQVQFIFLGDLHQLPPVYGQAVLGFKLLDLPTVELTKIYRQAALSPIISLAHRMKNGEDIPVSERTVVETEQGKVTIHPWKKALSDFDACHTTGIFLTNLIKTGHYDAENDIILCPQEKIKNLAFGTTEINKVIAQELGTARTATVHEIIAGFYRHYYAIGDRVLVGREDAEIVEISKNGRYWGNKPRTSSTELDRWGNYRKVPVLNNDEDEDIDKLLDNFTLTASENEEDRKQEASHVITVRLLDSEVTETVSTAGEINSMQFAYALTVHKSQGSEWNRVFFLTHQSHAVMWNRELLYTAITRARKELYMIVEPDRGSKKGTLWKSSKSPRIKGNTLAEKAEYFKGKKDEIDAEKRNELLTKGGWK